MLYSTTWLFFFFWLFVRAINTHSYIKYKLALELCLCMWVSVCVKQVVVRRLSNCVWEHTKAVSLLCDSSRRMKAFSCLWFDGQVYCGGRVLTTFIAEGGWQYVYPYHRDFIRGTECCCCCNLIPQTLSTNIGFVMHLLFLWGDMDISSRNIKSGFGSFQGWNFTSQRPWNSNRSLDRTSIMAEKV